MLVNDIILADTTIFLGIDLPVRNTWRKISVWAWEEVAQRGCTVSVLGDVR